MSSNINLPVKRTDSDQISERLTDNAYERILPERYLKRDEDGNVVEEQEELFERVAKNVAVAELVFTDDDLTVSQSHIKPDHPHRDEFIEDKMFNARGVPLTEDIAPWVSYDAIKDDLPSESRQKLVAWKEDFQERMERLQFIPNSPTLMNAGDDLQQLSACFVDSPEDDMEDIHETSKEAALIFQSGGGNGYAFSYLRPYGDPVGSTGGIASGPMTFMRTFDQVCETVAQGGTRRGAQMGVMRVTHPDIPFFIHAKNRDVSLAKTLQLNDPDDPKYTSFGDALEEARGLIDDGAVSEHLRNAVEGHLSNFNISVAITDDFMDAAENGENFELINPATGDPHIATEETKEMYEWFGLGEYVEVGKPLEVPAQELLDHIADGAHENGEPGVLFIDKANEDHSFPVESTPVDDRDEDPHQLSATNPCVTGDTLIQSEVGLIEIQDLVSDGMRTDIHVDRRLGSSTVQNIASAYKTGEKDVYKLSTDRGYELRLTADHRVMTDDGWVEAQNLNSGDTVHIGDTESWSDDDIDSEHYVDQGELLGWFVGDGYINKTRDDAVLSFFGDEMELAESFADRLKDPFEIDVDPRDIERDGEVNEKRVGSERFLEAIRERWNMETSHELPREAEYIPSIAKGFLRGLFSADGSVQGSPDSGAAVRLAQSDLELLKDVQQVLLNFGITSTIYENRREEGTRELPDGSGDTKEYDIDAQHDLHISKDNIERFAEKIGFIQDSKREQLDALLDSYENGPYSEDFTAKVESVEYDGHEEVYDLTEPETNSFIANGLVVHNCGEQWLEEYEACNLGHINLSTIVEKDAPDWRDFNGTVNEFLEQAIDWAELSHRIETGTRFLENVVTMSRFPVDEITETVRDNRKIGLGIMGLAQLYVQLGMKYGSEASNQAAREIMTQINQQSKMVSHEIAQERLPFNNWDESKYANPTEYPKWFKRQTGQNPADWEDGFPIRNHNTTTIAPTGTTSMVGNTSGGCEPIYSVAFFKNVSDDVQGDDMLVEFDDYFLRTLEANDIDVEAVQEEATEQMKNNEFNGIEGLSNVPDEIGELFVTTSDLSGEEHAAIQCAMQKGVDSSISKTVNFPNEATVEDVSEVIHYLYDNDAKGGTLYRDGTRQKQVKTTRADNKIDDDLDEDDALAQVNQLVDEFDLDIEAAIKERPKVLNSITERVTTGYGNMYVTVGFNEDDRPFEVLATIGKSGGFAESMTEGLCRSISQSLRSGVPVEEIIDQQSDIRSPDVGFDDGDTITSIPDGIAVALKRATERRSETKIETDSSNVFGGCPECGAEMKVIEGCEKCSAECGYSAC